MYSDEQILEGLRTNNSNVVKYLYNVYYVELCAFIVSRYDYRGDLQDYFQDALLTICEKSNKLTLCSSLKTFLFAIVKNKVKYELKKNLFIKMRTLRKRMCINLRELLKTNMFLSLCGDLLLVIMLFHLTTRTKGSMIIS